MAKLETHLPNNPLKVFLKKIKFRHLTVRKDLVSTRFVIAFPPRHIVWNPQRTQKAICGIVIVLNITIQWDSMTDRWAHTWIDMHSCVGGWKLHLSLSAHYFPSLKRNNHLYSLIHIYTQYVMCTPFLSGMGQRNCPHASEMFPDVACQENVIDCSRDEEGDSPVLATAIQIEHAEHKCLFEVTQMNQLFY